jgi:peptidyl-prolyl cis-trans isomerase C
MKEVSMNIKQVFLVLLLTFSLIRPAVAGQEEVIAKIGSMTVTASDFDRLVQFFSEQSHRDLSKDMQFKRSLFDGMVKRLALLEIAKRKGIDKVKGMRLILDFVDGNVLSTELIGQELGKKANVSEDEMLAYYRINQKEFRKPASAKVKQIFIKAAGGETAETSEKARERAEEVLRRLKSGESFAKLAAEFSDDEATKAKGGDLGYIFEGRYGKQIDDTIFKMKAGELSGVIEFPDGYRIFLVEKRRDAYTEPFKDVKEKIRVSIVEQTRKGIADELLEKAKKELGVEVHPEFLSSKEAGK